MGALCVIFVEIDALCTLPPLVRLQVLRDQTESLEEYAQLKRQLLKRTQRAGAALAAYLLLTVSGEARPRASCGPHLLGLGITASPPQP